MQISSAHSYQSDTRALLDIIRTHASLVHTVPTHTYRSWNRMLYCVRYEGEGYLLRNAATVEKQMSFKRYILQKFCEKLCSHWSEHYKKSKNGVDMLIIIYITQSDWFIMVRWCKYWILIGRFCVRHVWTFFNALIHLDTVFFIKLSQNISFKNCFFFNCSIFVSNLPPTLTPIAAPSQLPIVIGVRLRHQLVGSTIGARRYRTCSHTRAACAVSRAYERRIRNLADVFDPFAYVVSRFHFHRWFRWVNSYRYI